MNLHRKLGVHYFKFLLIMISLSLMLYLVLLMILVFLLRLFPVIYELDNPAGSIVTISFFVVSYIFFFAVSGFLYGRRMSDPIFYHLDWVDNLAEGSYMEPDQTKYARLKRKKTYALYQELTEKMRKLTGRLRHNEIERKRLEQMRKEWTSGVSHDLKTPLSYIHGYSAMLLSKEHKWTEEEQKHFLMIIQEKAVHIQHLIDDLSDVYQFEQGMFSLDKENMDMVAFLRRLVTDIQQQPDALHHQFEFTSEKETMMFSFDRYLLKRALTNLFMNAVIHNREETEIKVAVLEGSQGLTITISDDGVGMSLEESELLFQRYYRGTPTDASVSGTGLGMAIANQFIAAHQGTVDVKSSPGHGTAITISLPYPEG